MTETAAQASLEHLADPPANAAAQSGSSATIGVRSLALMVAILAVLSLWAASVPGSYFGLVLLLGFPWLGAAGIWMILVILMARRPSSWAAQARWLLGTAVVVALTALACWVQAPLQLRFALSLPAMNAVAHEMSTADSPEFLADRWIGLFDAESIERIDDGMRFLVKDTGFLDPVGFAYSPNGEPEVIGEDWYEPFAGPWWLWVESW